MKISDKTKNIFSTAFLIASAVGAFINVFEDDRKEKEFEALKQDSEEMKKAISELQKERS